MTDDRLAEEVRRIVRRHCGLEPDAPVTNIVAVEILEQMRGWARRWSEIRNTFVRLDRERRNWGR